METRSVPGSSGDLRLDRPGLQTPGWISETVLAGLHRGLFCVRNDCSLEFCTIRSPNDFVPFCRGKPGGRGRRRSEAAKPNVVLARCCIWALFVYLAFLRVFDFGRTDEPSPNQKSDHPL